MCQNEDLSAYETITFSKKKLQDVWIVSLSFLYIASFVYYFRGFHPRNDVTNVFRGVLYAKQNTHKLSVKSTMNLYSDSSKLGTK